MTVRRFATSQAWRAWLERHHADARELWLAFYTKASGRRALTYPEAVDQALCFGWIDGVRRTLDVASYVNRFSPRTSRSRWSAVNVERFKALRAAKLVAPSGLAAFDAWDGRPAPYSFQHRDATLAPALLARFQAHADAWAWFSARPPGYRRTAVFWVMSAVQEATRVRRLDVLVADSRDGRAIAPLRRPDRAGRQAPVHRRARPRTKRIRR